MQAITTRYAGPSVRGSRVIVRCDAGRMIVPWDDALDSEENHQRAARVLATKLGWTGRRFVTGSIPGGGYVHVIVAKHDVNAWST